jgi:colanic acid/amylovoran biosynthesis protein
MNFVIVGPALTGNKGAAAMLESSIQTLTVAYPNSEFVLLSTYPEEDAKLNTLKNLKIVSSKPLYLGLVVNPAAIAWRVLPPVRKLLLRKIPALKAYTEADMVLDQGGITFSDGREKYLLFNVATILPALVLKKKVFKCAQAIGPFKNPINRLMAKFILPKVHTIVARGKYTFSNLKKLGLKNIVLGADYAFALEFDKRKPTETSPFLDHIIFKNGRVVGISPSVVIKKYCDKNNVDYISIMAKFIDYLTENDYGVLLVPHSVRMDETKIHNNDLPLCRTIFEAINKPNKCCLIDKELSSQSLRYIIGKCDLFVASRFHAMVSSLSMGVPTMVIGWSHKYAEVLGMFDIEEWAFSYKEISYDYLVKNFENFQKKEPIIKNNINRNLPAVKKAAYKHVDFIKQGLSR